jgi:hypothetical protein
MLATGRIAGQPRVVTFEQQSSQFKPVVHKSIHMHINFRLFADILRELAATVGRIPKDDVMHRDQLAKAVSCTRR